MTSDDYQVGYNEKFEWQKEVAGLVTLLASIRISQEDIAGAMGMSVRTLRKYYQKEIDTGRTIITAKAMSALVQNIEKGKERSIIFWLSSMTDVFIKPVVDTRRGEQDLDALAAPAVEPEIPITLEAAKALYERLRK